ncbi:CLUMA_CG006284, isoform B, partial [Clunio marinus]
MIGEQSQIMGDTEYLTNYAHIKHSHRHSHYHLRRQSQPDSDVRLMSRNSSSVKSFISQCYNNPEYFDEIRPARSYDDSRASLISRKLSNQIVLLNSELQLLEQMRDHSHSYPHINYPEKDYLSEKDQFHAEQTTTTSSTSSEECSDASEFHEKKASTLERKVSRLTSETDSYSAINDEITQLISKHFSNSIKQLVAQRFTDVGMYTLPLRRRHSCGSTESYDDIIIPELFNSPSRIKWNFLTGLPDHSRSHSRIDSSDYKTDLEDDDECNNHPQGWRRCKRVDHNMKERKSFSFDSKQQQGYETVSMWRTNSYPETHESILQHDTEEFLDTYCEGHSKEFEHGQENSEEKVEDSGSVYEFELCTKENCEYLSKSQVMLPQQSTESENPLNNNKTFAINNSLPSNKNINLKHNKLKLKKKVKKKSTVKANHNRDPEDFLMWSKINFSHLIKKDSCNINSVNLKPNSNSSSSHSLNNMGVRNRRNKKSYQKFTNKWLQQQPPGSLDIATLILASSASTQVRFRSDGGIYFSNPDLSNIPVDLRSVTNFTNNNNNINSNNSCQFINNDLRNTINFNVNVNCHSIDHSHSRGRFDLASNYLTVEESSINSNNIDTFNDSEILQQQHLRGRLRYNRFNLNGIVRRAQKH